MMFDKVIDEGTLRALPSGFSVGVRLPWYRALPLSTISVNSLRIDGQDVAPERIRFMVNDKAYSLPELADLFEEMWFTTDTATLEVADWGLTAGSEHEITAEIEIRPPYIKGLRRVGRVTKTMRVH